MTPNPTDTTTTNQRAEPRRDDLRGPLGRLLWAAACISVLAAGVFLAHRGETPGAWFLLGLALPTAVFAMAGWLALEQLFARLDAVEAILQRMQAHFDDLRASQRHLDQVEAAVRRLERRAAQEQLHRAVDQLRGEAP